LDTASHRTLEGTIRSSSLAVVRSCQKALQIHVVL
jgi:hypothetical protein